MSTKKLIKALGLIIVVALMAAALPLQAKAQTDPLTEVWVCPTGDCGHPGFSYNTIQAGINAVAANGTVNVAAGTYVENVVVNKAITLQGAGSVNTTIVATNGNATPLTFNANDATVSGFHLTHNYTQAELDAWNFNNNGVIFYQNTTGNTLSDCKITKNRNGIYINNARNNIIQKNTIENNRTGLNLTNYVDGTKIQENFIQNNWTIGLVYYQGSAGLPTNFDTVTVTGNSFINNWYSEILIKNALPSPADTGTLNVTDNTFSDIPVTYTTSADPKWNEPSHADLKPVEFGGSATMPTTPLPTLRIYGVPGVTLRYDHKTLMVGASQPYTTIQSAIDAASDGDMINVAPGTYAENLQINKAVNLLGLQNTRTFDSVVIGEQAPDVWYVDRYAPAAFESFDFGGRKVLRHGVLGSQKQSQSFYNYQGRKLDVNLSGPTITVSIDLFVGSDWGSTQRNAGFWATGLDSENAVSAYPMIAWRSGGTDPAGFYAFDYFYGGWDLLHAAGTEDYYGKWHNLAFTYNVGEGVSYFIDGEFSGSFADSYTTQISNIILNVYNFGEYYDVYWDNLTNFTNEAKVTGLVNISAADVVVDGFTLENPGQPTAVDINSTASNMTLKHNVIQNVGGSSVGQMQAIYLEHGPDNVLIEGNTFKDISSGTSSAKAILSGDSNTTDPATGLRIRANTFSNISASRGAYGVILNNGAGNPGAIIEANAFNGLSGAWTHAIGLEGLTANAKVENNAFAGLTATSPDNSAIFFEDNSGGGSVAVKYNKFFHSGLGVGIHPDDQPGGANNFNYTVDASPNWWGSISGPVVSTQIFGSVTYEPWCGDAECSFLNPNYLEPGVTAENIQDAIDDAQEGEIIVIPAGTYNKSGAFTISTPRLTIKLSDGTVIQNSSPCFVINASYTQIIAEPGAKCIPTDNSNGIDVAAGLTDVRVKGLEILPDTDAAAGDGIHFAGAINNLMLLDNYIHDMPEDGVEFVTTPTGEVDIQGNLFENNVGLGINAPGSLNAEYNSWGDYDGPDAAAGGDGISIGVDAAPWTHADVYMVSSGSPWANQVVKGQTITYTIKGNLQNVNAADITFSYPEGLTVSDSGVITTSFDSEAEVAVDAATRTITYHAVSTTGNKTGLGLDMFWVKFTAGSTMRGIKMDIVDGSFGFGGLTYTNNVYLQSAVDGSITVIDLPTLTSEDIGGPYLAGVPQDFHVMVKNPAAGGNFVDSIYYVFTIANAELEDIYSLVCDGNTVSLTESGDDLIGRTGYDGHGFPMPPDGEWENTCTVNFKTAKSYDFSVDMVDNTSSPFDPTKDIQLVNLTATATVNGGFAITGTFSMQGRLTRGGIPVTLGWTGTEWTYSASAATTDVMANNFNVNVTYGGGYLITTLQPRYLNITTELAKSITVNGAETITPALMLRGGNAKWRTGSEGNWTYDNEVNIDDASIVGTDYNKTGDIDADCNFDGVVNIFDLALVGGNFNMDSGEAYGSWSPVTLP